MAAARNATATMAETTRTTPRRETRYQQPTTQMSRQTAAAMIGIR